LKSKIGVNWDCRARHGLWFHAMGGGYSHRPLACGKIARLD